MSSESQLKSLEAKVTVLEEKLRSFEVIQAAWDRSLMTPDKFANLTEFEKKIVIWNSMGLVGRWVIRTFQVVTIVAALVLLVPQLIDLIFTRTR